MRRQLKQRLVELIGEPGISMQGLSHSDYDQASMRFDNGFPESISSQPPNSSQNTTDPVSAVADGSDDELAENPMPLPTPIRKMLKGSNGSSIVFPGLQSTTPTRHPRSPLNATHALSKITPLRHNGTRDQIPKSTSGSSYASLQMQDVSQTPKPAPQKRELQINELDKYLQYKRRKFIALFSDSEGDDEYGGNEEEQEISGIESLSKSGWPDPENSLYLAKEPDRIIVDDSSGIGEDYESFQGFSENEGSVHSDIGSYSPIIFQFVGGKGSQCPDESHSPQGNVQIQDLALVPREPPRATFDLSDSDSSDDFASPQWASSVSRRSKLSKAKQEPTNSIHLATKRQTHTIVCNIIILSSAISSIITALDATLDLFTYLYDVQVFPPIPLI